MPQRVTPAGLIYFLSFTVGYRYHTDLITSPIESIDIYSVHCTKKLNANINIQL